MSTERLEELGVPRRAFLKKAGAAALAAPLIVSFGMDAIAEASPTAQSLPNQCYANQIFANQALYPGQPLWDILTRLFDDLFASRIGGLKPALSVGAANQLAILAVQAGVYESADELVTAYEVWGKFITLAKGLTNYMPAGLGTELIEEAQRAQEQLDCN
jgi:hypothetical protein